MACRSCGGGRGGGGRGTVMIASANTPARVAAPAPEAPVDMVYIEYVGIQTQFRSLRSKVHPQRTYRYGGEIGSQDRFFLVYKGDEVWLTQYNEFRLAKTPAPQTVEADTLATSMPVLSSHMTAPAVLPPAPLPRPAPEAVPSQAVAPEMPVEALLLDPEILSILRSAGFVTIPQLRAASTADLVSIKGMGVRRAKKVKVALDAVV